MIETVQERPKVPAKHRRDTPIDGGFGADFERWAPAMAFRAWEAEQALRQKHEQLKEAVAKMAGTATVNDCVPAHFDYDQESGKSPVEQYVDWLGFEAERAALEVEVNGGPQAVEVFTRWRASISYAGERPPMPQINPVPSRPNFPA